MQFPGAKLWKNTSRRAVFVDTARDRADQTPPKAQQRPTSIKYFLPCEICQFELLRVAGGTIPFIRKYSTICP
jgi:hypothetical protein